MKTYEVNENKMSEALRPNDIMHICHLPEGQKVLVNHTIYYKNIGKNRLKESFKGSIVKEFTHHILVLVKGKGGKYTRSIDKVDIATGNYSIKPIY